MVFVFRAWKSAHFFRFTCWLTKKITIFTAKWGFFCQPARKTKKMSWFSCSENKNHQIQDVFTHTMVLIWGQTEHSSPSYSHFAKSSQDFPPFLKNSCLGISWAIWGVVGPNLNQTQSFWMLLFERQICKLLLFSNPNNWLFLVDFFLQERVNFFLQSPVFNILPIGLTIRPEIRTVLRLQFVTNSSWKLSNQWSCS